MARSPLVLRLLLAPASVVLPLASMAVLPLAFVAVLLTLAPLDLFSAPAPVILLV